jgi:hypothetical protein
MLAKAVVWPSPEAGERFLTRRAARIWNRNRK